MMKNYKTHYIVFYSLFLWLSTNSSSCLPNEDQDSMEDIKQAFARLDPCNAVDREALLTFIREYPLETRNSFICELWPEFSKLYHPLAPSYETLNSIYEKESTIKSQKKITSFLFRKEPYLSKSKILLYSGDEYIASTSIQGSLGSFDELALLLNPLNVPWATKGSMKLYNSELLLNPPENGYISATAMCDGILVAAHVKNPQKPSTILTVCSQNGSGEIARKVYQQEGEPCQKNEHFTVPIAHEPGMVTSLYMPAPWALYIGNDKGDIIFYDFRKNNVIRHYLRTSVNPITLIAGEENASYIAWVENFTRILIWSSEDQIPKILEHNLLRNAYITSLDIHPSLPLLLIATSTGKVLLYDYYTNTFYPHHNGCLAGFDYDGYLVVIDQKPRGDIVVKRYAFPDFTNHSMLHLALLSKIMQKGLNPSQFASPWKEQYEEIPDINRRRISKYKRKISLHREKSSHKK